MQQVIFHLIIIIFPFYEYTFSDVEGLDAGSRDSKNHPRARYTPTHNYGHNVDAHTQAQESLTRDCKSHSKPIHTHISQQTTKIMTHTLNYTDTQNTTLCKRVNVPTMNYTPPPVRRYKK